jgi:hypothetical protein
MARRVRSGQDVFGGGTIPELDHANAATATIASGVATLGPFLAGVEVVVENRGAYDMYIRTDGVAAAVGSHQCRRLYAEGDREIKLHPGVTTVSVAGTSGDVIVGIPAATVMAY